MTNWFSCARADCAFQLNGKICNTVSIISILASRSLCHALFHQDYSENTSHTHTHTETDSSLLVLVKTSPHQKEHAMHKHSCTHKCITDTLNNMYASLYLHFCEGLEVIYKKSKKRSEVSLQMQLRISRPLLSPHVLLHIHIFMSTLLKVKASSQQISHFLHTLYEKQPPLFTFISLP